MDLTALDENIERLTDEVRRAKQECLAFFVSLQVSAEHVRQNQQELRQVEFFLDVCRRDQIVDFAEYAKLRDVQKHYQDITKGLDFHIAWDSGGTFAEKLTRYRELLAQLNQHLEVAAYRAPIIEFRRDNRRSNRPPPH